ncbi:MAG: thioredoxin family protein, partial [Bacteroidota bacterium]
MKKLLVAFLLLSPVLLFAQNEGIQFSEGMTWSQVKAKAKAENKYIFMDCFTTWCGPCKYMSANVFPMKSVGDVINKNFVAVAVQLDTTDKDNDFVKSWYQDGHDIAKDYKIRAYPTYLYFSPDGKLVHRAVGSSTDDVFITKAENALDPAKQYYTLL